MQIDIILAPLSLCLSTQEISRVSFSFTQTDSFIHSFMQQMFIDLLILCQILWRTWSTLLQIIVCGNFSIRSQDHSKKRMKEGKNREGREKEGKLSKKRRRCTDMNEGFYLFMLSTTPCLTYFPSCSPSALLGLQHFKTFLIFRCSEKGRENLVPVIWLVMWFLYEHLSHFGF